MSSLAIASILEELRCMDGELFKAEICQRVYMWLKTQACEALEPVFCKSTEEYKKVVEAYRAWSPQIEKEELVALYEKSGGAEELQSAWVTLSMHWVRLNKKGETGKGSIKIRNPESKDLLKHFFVTLCSKSWCIKGDLWSMDPVKQDFVFREVFRHSVANSIHFLQDEGKEEGSRPDSALYEDTGKDETRKKNTETEERERQEEMRVQEEMRAQQEQKDRAQREEREQRIKAERAQREMEERLEQQMVDQRLEEQRLEERRLEEQRLEKQRLEQQTREEKTREELRLLEATKEEQRLEQKLEQKLERRQEMDLRDMEQQEVQREREQKVQDKQEDMTKRRRSESMAREEEDDIGPDDSISHFFGTSRIEPPKFPEPPRRFADAGTVLYNSAPRRVLVKPITLKLESPVQKPE
jgi:hypothetical protein